jgi:fructosamine-3-kinase
MRPCARAQRKRRVLFMDKAVKHHLGKKIKEKTQLKGGYTFQTWLLTLSDNQKVVFRSQRDFYTGGGRKIIIADVLEREKYFYDNINQKIGRICPEVYVVDGTRDYFDTSYCIMEYIEGTPLVSCFGDFGTKQKKDVLFKIGETAARINSMEIGNNHHYVASRNSWEEYIANRLNERLTALINNQVITQDEINKITESMRQKKAAKEKSFFFFFLRHINMIFNNGDIFILDAENCEFGDPLFELATIDAAGELEPILTDGYRKAYVENIDLESELYHYYKMERLALVLNVFMNEVKDDTESTRIYLNKFHNTKNTLLMLCKK